jgi:hypothetical protein
VYFEARAKPIPSSGLARLEKIISMISRGR